MKKNGLVNCARLLAELPPFRPVAIQLLRVMQDPSSSLGEVAGLLRADPVLTAELLRVANSPLFPSRYEIQTALQAVAFLGLDMVGSLVATSALRALTSGRHVPLAQACWRHSLATALACQRWSQILRLSAERCYTAGLLHDIGQLAFLRVFPEYPGAVAPAVGAHGDLVAAESEILGMDHCEAGRWLLAQWGCPVDLQNAAAWHANPPQEGTYDRDLVMLVGAASQLAESVQLCVFPTAQPPGADQVAGAVPEPYQKAVEEDFHAAAEWVVDKIGRFEHTLTASA